MSFEDCWLVLRWVPSQGHEDGNLVDARVLLFQERTARNACHNIEDHHGYDD